MVEEIKRMNYFNGLFLKEEDFITDQNYNIQMRRLMNWSLNRVYGILEGLDVVPAEGKAYKVGSGVAISKSENEFGNGAEIVLPSDEYLNFSGKAPGDYYIAITYNETKGDKDESKGSQEIHWIERPKIDIQSKFPDSPEKDIILAKITVPESENWKSDSKYVKADERKEIGPALRYINDKVDVKSSWIKLGQEKNGGGHLIVANNRNDEAIYLEAHNSDSNGSASSLVLSGSAAQNVKTLDARVDNTVFRGSANFEGNVGIGTANPSAKLNVDPHGKGGILVGNPNWQNGGYTSLIMEVSEEKGGYAWITSIKSSGKEPGNICFNPQYSTGNVGIGTANPSARLEVIGNIKGSNNLIIAGNVGIGTDKPDCALHVNGTRIKLGTEKEGQLFIAGENNILYLEANGSGNNNTVSELTICGNSVNNIPKLNLCADNTSFNGNINLPGTINANQNLLIQGNVGIGTTTPDGKLDVRGSICAGNSDIYFTKTDHQYKGFAEREGYAAIENDSVNFKALMILGRKVQDKRFVRLWDYLQVNGSLDVTGNVGIGTANPSTKLEVNGEIKANAINSKPALQEFKVEGELEKFYPIYFFDNNWGDGPLILEINRTNVHIDAEWKGSMISRFTVHSTNFGHGSETCRAEIYDSGAPFIAGYKNDGYNARFVLWLKGSTTYYFRSNHFVTLEDSFAKEKKYKIGEMEIIYEIKTSVDSYVVRNGIHFDKNFAIDGYVGIGTTNPSAKLEVNGDIKVNGKVIQQDWVQPTLQNGWENYGDVYNPAGYFLDKNGIVHLRGLVKKGTTSIPIFRLSEFCQPAAREIHIVLSSDSFVRCDILTNGDVILISGNKKDWVSLDGITFRAK